VRDFLAFQLHGPLAAWGESAVGQERDSSLQPSRSAVLGLLAAAAGIRRDADADHLALSRDLGFGCVALSAGLGMRDFHTAQRAKSYSRVKHLKTRRDELAHDKIDTVISYRGYRQDSLAVAAVWTRGDETVSLEHLAGALQRPVFTLYLGRRACPLALPLNPVILTCAALKDALDAYATDHLDAAVRSKGFVGQAAVSYHWDALDAAGMSADAVVTRHDDVLSRVRWQHGEREEHMAWQSAQEVDRVPQ